MIAIIDYGMGNLRSVQKVFEKEGAFPRIVSRPVDVEKADKIILPGVGAFDQAMAELKKRRLIAPLKEKIDSGIPFLGLCLGLQLLFTRSQEGRSAGLGVIEGSVQRFKGRMKIPHMGWNTLIRRDKDCSLFKGVPADDYFYFVHSYFAVPADRSCVASQTVYGGISFCSSIWRGNIFATQFHPEKSQGAGLKMIKNFIEYPGVSSR